MTPTFRFAPSPTGLLHLGHALSAFSVQRAAEAAGGRVLLRIEDTDLARCRPEFSEAIEQDLAWIGFRWDGPVRRQSAHFDDYAAALARLEAMGLVYPCRLSRGDIAAVAGRLEAQGRRVLRDPEGALRLPLEGVTAGDPAGPLARRLRMAPAIASLGGRTLVWSETGVGPDGESGALRADPAAWGDVVVARKDTPTSYHLAVVVDDALQGVTHVVRGQDLFHATAIHRLLQELLGLPAPVYRHHRLLTDDAGQRLSKTRGSPSLRSLRAAGWTPDDVRAAVGAL